MRVSFQKTIIRPLLLVLVGAFFFFYGLGAFGLLGPDEPRYAQVAREMARSGDWLTPRIAGIPWLEKPPLLYWLMTGSMKLFGIGEWSARFPSALCGLMLMVALFAFGKQVRSARMGMISAVVFATTTMAVSFAHGATTDMLLTASVGMALGLFFLAQNPTFRYGTVAISSSYALVGIAMLAKGLVGAIIPILVMVTFALLSRGAGLRTRCGPLRGLAIAILIAGAWYGPMLAKYGWSFIDQFFIQHHLRRYLSNQFHHPGPFYYYLPVLVGGTFPWSGFLVASAARLPRDFGRSAEPSDRLHAYCWAWIIMPTLFFSISGSKLPGYILPAFPAVALLVALEVEDLLEGRSTRWTRLACSATALFLLLVGGSGMIYSHYRLGVTLYPLVAGSVLLTGLGAILYLFLRRSQYAGFLIGIVGGAALMLVLLKLWVMPSVAAKDSMRDPAAFLLDRMSPDEPIIGYFIFPSGLTFYTDARSIYGPQGEPRIYSSPEELVGLLQIRSSIVIVTSPQVLPAIQSDSRFDANVLRRDQEYVFVRLRRHTPRASAIR